MLQYVAVCCSVLQCVAVCCSVLRCFAVCCSVCAFQYMYVYVDASVLKLRTAQGMTPLSFMQQHTAAHCSTLQHTATHCNTLQHTATHCNTLQHTAATDTIVQESHTVQGRTPLYSMQQLTATHYNTLQQQTCLCYSFAQYMG